MTDINENLIQLAVTKNAIKEAIVNKGVEVSDTDTFAQYADRIIEIPTGSGSKKYKMGMIYKNENLIYGSVNEIVYQNNQIGLKTNGTRYYSSTGGYPAYSMSGVQPMEYYDSSYYNLVRVVTTSINNLKVKELKNRQHFIINDQFSRPASRVADSNYYGFLCGNSKLSTSYYAYGIYVNWFEAGSEYDGQFWVIYTGNGSWLDTGGTYFNIGDEVDITWEFTDDSTFQITEIVNNGTPKITTITPTEWASVASLGTTSVGSAIYFGGNGTYGGSALKNGINCTLLEGTSIYYKTGDKYLWQLFEEVE